MIGIFDSGIGGFTVVREMMRRMPDYRLLYFGDTARTPYGNKGAEVIKQYAREDAEFLLSKGAKIIIIACNTVSAVAYDYLCEKFPNIPIFEVIMPAAEAAAITTKNGRIGVIGTRATINSGIYERKIKSSPFEKGSTRCESGEGFCKDVSTKSPTPPLTKGDVKFEVFSAPCPLLVPLVEEGWLEAPETRRIARKYLFPLKCKQIDTLILGCTHYPLIKNIIRGKIGKKAIVVDSAEEVVGKIFTYLQNNPEIDKNLMRGTEHQFFVSDLTSATEITVSKWLGKNIKLNYVRISTGQN